MRKKALIIGGLALLTACSRYASTSEQLYLYSKNGPGLTVPSPLIDSNISHFYHLPMQDNNARISIRPPLKKQGG